ncbi:unnamed protein product [Lactuca saligna]|uniref:Uncharacterized protein n=1 Tax=Lactuca saligna TaxID=75948 RepID=A0AA35Z851_LACSI|nr:unnamed protein product [Lactuca saligna]
MLPRGLAGNPDLRWRFYRLKVTEKEGVPVLLTRNSYLRCNTFDKILCRFLSFCFVRACRGCSSSISCFTIAFLLATLYSVTNRSGQKDLYSYDRRNPFDFQKGWFLWAGIGLVEPLLLSYLELSWPFSVVSHLKESCRKEAGKHDLGGWESDTWRFCTYILSWFFVHNCFYSFIPKPIEAIVVIWSTSVKMEKPKGDLKRDVKTELENLYVIVEIFRFKGWGKIF